MHTSNYIAVFSPSFLLLATPTLALSDIFLTESFKSHKPSTTA